MSETTPPNPLKDTELEVSLDELFSKDPVELTTEDQDRIIEALEEARGKYFKEANAAKKSGKRVPRKAGISNPKALSNIDTDNLLKKLEL